MTRNMPAPHGFKIKRDVIDHIPGMELIQYSFAVDTHIRQTIPEEQEAVASIVGYVQQRSIERLMNETEDVFREYRKENSLQNPAFERNRSKISAAVFYQLYGLPNRARPASQNMEVERITDAVMRALAESN